jgi:hypothetical protein
MGNDTRKPISKNHRTHGKRVIGEKEMLSAELIWPFAAEINGSDRKRKNHGNH